MNLTEANLLQKIKLSINQLEELHPLVFRGAFGLTHEQAAYELCVEPQTMRAYTKKQPSKRVKKLAATTARQWVINGHNIVEPELLWKAIFENAH